MRSAQPQNSSYWRDFIWFTFMAYLIGVPLMILIAVLVSPLTYWLWNWLMPELFGFQQISWLQAVGLVILARLLLSSR